MDRPRKSTASPAAQSGTSNRVCWAEADRWMPNYVSSSKRRAEARRWFLPPPLRGAKASEARELLTGSASHLRRGVPGLLVLPGSSSIVLGPETIDKRLPSQGPAVKQNGTPRSSSRSLHKRGAISEGIQKECHYFRRNEARSVIQTKEFTPRGPEETTSRNGLTLTPNPIILTPSLSLSTRQKNLLPLPSHRLLPEAFPSLGPSLIGTSKVSRVSNSGCRMERFR
jgi:hypothetical protein